MISGTRASLDGTTHASLDEAIAKLPGRPVALLQSDRTASAAEAVLVCFSGQSGVRSFGTTSHGFASANESIDLPDGSRLILTTAFFDDRNGTEYRAGITPGRADPHRWIRATGCSCMAPEQCAR
jgi:C-terminal processing protease CtpA/Prc